MLLRCKGWLFVFLYDRCAVRPLPRTFVQYIIEKGCREKQRQRSSRLIRGQNLFNSLPRWLFRLGRFERIGWIHIQMIINARFKNEMMKFCSSILKLGRICTTFGKTKSIARDHRKFISLKGNLKLFKLNAHPVLFSCCSVLTKTITHCGRYISI